jgi:hypothetical protein
VIVISGALVLVALVLLVIGLIGPSLGFVYASIGASLAAFAFLVVGILQRRKEEPVGIDGAPTSAADIAAAIRTPETRPVSTEELTTSGVEGEVLVVEGRPRYHVGGCRYLTGKDATTVAVSQARADGYTACGVCKPDEALASAPAQVEEPVPADDAHVAIVEPAAEVAPAVAKATAKRTPARTAAPAKAAKAAAPARKAATAAKAAAPARKAAPAAKAAAKAPAKAAKAPAKAAAKAVTKTAAKAPAKAAAKKAPAKTAAKKAPAKKATAKR